MEKIITVKSSQIITKDDRAWVELIDQEGKKHNVFNGVSLADGTYRDISDKVAMLKEYIESDSLNGKAIKLYKEKGKKGNFLNVIDVEMVKDVFVQRAQQQVEDEQATIKNKSVALSYAKDLFIGAGNPLSPSILNWAETFYRYIIGDLDIKPVALIIKSVEEQSETKTPENNNKAKVNEAVSTEKTRQMPLERPGEEQRATKEDLARLKEAMKTHSRTKDDMAILCRSFNFPTDSTKLNVRQIDFLIDHLERYNQKIIEP